MQHARPTLSHAVRLLVLAAAFSAPLAYADDYGDVNQLLRSGKFSEALGKADQYLAAKPRDPQMRFLKGVIQTESGKPADAITTFTRLTEDNPELPEPYNNLAVLYAGQSQFDKARAALEMAIRTNPSYATAHENLGDVYAKLASQAYSKALQLDGSNTGVQPKLALIRELFSPAAKGQKPASPPAPGATAAPAPVAGGADKDVEAAVRAWAAAWSAKDMGGYLAAYGKDFDTPGRQSRKAWEDDRRARIMGKSRISVKLDELAISVHGNKATARFREDYSADSLSVSSRKTLELVKAGERWAIVKESTGA
ncbi:MAG: tetratricopeptide repeat protein [Burkholderiaceae bacterium]